MQEYEHAAFDTHFEENISFFFINETIFLNVLYAFNSSGCGLSKYTNWVFYNSPLPLLTGIKIRVIITVVKREQEIQGCDLRTTNAASWYLAHPYLSGVIPIVCPRKEHTKQFVRKASAKVI